MGLVHVSPVPCSRSCCCACAFLLGIAEGLPLSLWLSFIAEGLPLAPVSLGYILLIVAAVAINSTPFPCFGCTVKPFQSY